MGPIVMAHLGSSIARSALSVSCCHGEAVVSHASCNGRRCHRFARRDRFVDVAMQCPGDESTVGVQGNVLRRGACGSEAPVDSTSLPGIGERRHRHRSAPVSGPVASEADRRCAPHDVDEVRKRNAIAWGRRLRVAPAAMVHGRPWRHLRRTGRPVSAHRRCVRGGHPFGGATRLMRRPPGADRSAPAAVSSRLSSDIRNWPPGDMQK